MANSFLSSLDTLDPTSVGNISSLFFFVSNNGNSRLVDGTTMQTYLGRRQSTIVTKTNVQTFSPAATDIAVSWDEAPRDPWGMWSASSATLITVPFSGFVQFRYRTQVAGNGGTYFISRVCSGDSTQGLPGAGLHLHYDQQTEYRRDAWTAPISVSPGRIFTLQLEFQSVCYTNTLEPMRNWLECIPLKVYL